MVKLSAQLIVSYLKAINDPHQSQSKIMILLYYLQGIHLAAFCEPLFQDKIIHYSYGPFVPIVQETYESTQEISKEKMGSFPKSEFINDVVSFFTEYNALSLTEKSQGEWPWKETKELEEISFQDLYDFFSSDREFQDLVLNHTPAPPLADFSELNEFLDFDNEDEIYREEMVRKIIELVKTQNK